MRARHRRRCGAWALGIGASLTLLASPAASLSIRYRTSDLADVTPGQDLWRTEYRLDAFPYGAGHGFSIGFDPANTIALEESPATPHPAWDVITLQPDPLLPAAGLYDALALTSAAPVDAVFAVSFVWAGPGTPTEQPFSVYDPSFGTLESGVTRAPEPAAALLVTSGLALLGKRRSLGRRNHRREREP